MLGKAPGDKAPGDKPPGDQSSNGRMMIVAKTITTSARSRMAL